MILRLSTSILAGDPDRRRCSRLLLSLPLPRDPRGEEATLRTREREGGGRGPRTGDVRLVVDVDVDDGGAAGKSGGEGKESRKDGGRESQPSSSSSLSLARLSAGGGGGTVSVCARCGGGGKVRLEGGSEGVMLELSSGGQPGPPWAGKIARRRFGWWDARSGGGRVGVEAADVEALEEREGEWVGEEAW